MHARAGPLGGGIIETLAWCVPGVAVDISELFWTIRYYPTRSKVPYMTDLLAGEKVLET